MCVFIVYCCGTSFVRDQVNNNNAFLNNSAVFIKTSQIAVSTQPPLALGPATLSFITSKQIFQIFVGVGSTDCCKNLSKWKYLSVCLFPVARLN